MNDTAEKTNGEEPETQPSFTQMQQPDEKPELPADMAAWLVNKLDCPFELNGHQDRNNFAAVINRLIAIANWKEPE